MANGDIIKITQNGTIGGVIRTVNTFHYKDNSGGSTNFDPYTVASDWQSAFTAILAAAAGANATFESVGCEILAGPGIGKTAIFDINPVLAGARAGPFEPSNICAVMSRHTVFGGRKERGRFYFSPLPTLVMAVPGLGLVDTTDAPLIAVSAIAVATFTTATVALTPVLARETAPNIWQASGPLVTAVLRGAIRSLRSRFLRTD